MNQHKKGYTFIQLVITIAIIAIISAIAIPIYQYVVDEARIVADHKTITILNETTVAYAAMNNLQKQDDIFSGINTNSNRIQQLIDSNYLDNIVKPQQKDVDFEWIIDNQIWNLSNEIIIQDDLSLYSVWEQDTRYRKNTYLVHNDKLYYSRRRTRKEQGTGKQCQEISDQWVFYNTYYEGDIIELEGQKYIALKKSSKRSPEDFEKHWGIYN